MKTFFQAWRAQLGRFGLSGAHQTSPIKQLSDGLRNRYATIFSAHFFLIALSVVFAQLAMEHPHILLLGIHTFFSKYTHSNIFHLQMSLQIIWIWSPLML